MPYQQIGDVCVLKRGKAITKSTATEGDVPVVAGGMNVQFTTAESNHPAPCLAVSSSGSAGYVSWWNEPVWVGDAFSIDPADEQVLSRRFLYHWLKSRQEGIYRMKRGGAVPHVYPSQIAAMEIPIPPLDVQNRIVTVLDALTRLEETLEECENVSNGMARGIPTEIDQRRAQLNWYRRSLLAFPRAGC